MIVVDLTEVEIEESVVEIVAAFKSVVSHVDPCSDVSAPRLT